MILTTVQEKHYVRHSIELMLISSRLVAIVLHLSFLISHIFAWIKLIRGERRERE